MGRVDVSLLAASDKRRHVAWHALVDARGVPLPGRGALELMLWWKHNPDVAANLVMDLTDADEVACSLSLLACQAVEEVEGVVVPRGERPVRELVARLEGPGEGE